MAPNTEVHTARNAFGPRALSGLARLASARLIQGGVDPEPLLRKAGLSPLSVAPAEARIEAQRSTDFLNLAADALQDELLGFHLARDYDLRELGPFYYVMASAPTLGQAIAREQRYSWTVDEGLRTICRRTDKLTIDVECVGIERRSGRHQMEFWLTCTLRKSRQFTDRELAPTYVGFVHGPEGDASEMERYFGRAPEFRAPADRVCFDHEVADLPQVTADPYLHGLLIDYLEEATANRPRMPDRLRVRVENAITPRLPHGTARMDAIAGDLGMSARTLSRRLADESVTFGAIVDELRSVLADRYLRNQELSISQVAWLLGYTEPSSFVRALHRWTGQSPTAMRRGLAQGARGKPGSGPR